MKKVLFVLALVAVYGVSLAMTQATLKSNNETVTVVSDYDVSEKEEGKKAKGEAKGETKAEASDSKAKACSGEKAAKSDCSKSCDGKKTAEAKSDCSKSCSDKK